MRRLDRFRQGSTQTKNSIRHNSNRSVTVDKQEKQGSKHEVSLKNIVFEGSQRKLSVLHPSHKPSIKIGSQKAI